MKATLKNFIEAGDKLVENWDFESSTELYPKYMPSFDEFMADMRVFLDGEKL